MPNAVNNLMLLRDVATFHNVPLETLRRLTHTGKLRHAGKFPGKQGPYYFDRTYIERIRFVRVPSPHVWPAPASHWEIYDLAEEHK